MNRKLVIIGSVLIIIVFSFVLFNQVNEGERIISLEEYKEYDDYGLDLDESTVFAWLLDNLDLEDFEEVTDSFLFESTDKENYRIIEDKLILCDRVDQLLMTRDDNGDLVNFMIDYHDHEDKRIIITYTYTGYVNKTIGYKNKIVSISNDLLMETMGR